MAGEALKSMSATHSGSVSSSNKSHFTLAVFRRGTISSKLKVVMVVYEILTSVFDLLRMT